MASASIKKLIKGQLTAIRKKISQHEKALKALRKEEKDIAQAAKLLTGKGPAVTRKKSGPRRKTKAGRKVRRRTGAVRKGGRTNWDATIKSMPSTFTMDQLAKSRGAKGKSRAYLHQIINRWKKAGAIKSAGRAKYQKT
jgi:hypothetical protein